LTDTQTLALNTAGVGRLLTPAELDAKTRALTGYAWGEGWNPGPLQAYNSRLKNELLVFYGGIDGVGVTERSRETNALMANVALAQAATLSCPTVILDFAQRKSQRLLFKEVERTNTPLDFGSLQTEVTGSADRNRNGQELAVSGLSAQPADVRVNFVDPFYDGELQEGSTLVIHRIELRNANNSIVFSINGQDFDTATDFRDELDSDGNRNGGIFWDDQIQRETGWQLFSGGFTLGLRIPSDGDFTLRVQTSRRGLPGRAVTMNLALRSKNPQTESAGRTMILAQLQFLHDRLLGEKLAQDDPEILASYALFVELWQDWQQQNPFDNAIDFELESCDIPIPDWWDQDRSQEFRDPESVVNPWMSMLVYLMTDYRYLHE
jgi:hypothetical protein